VRSAKPFRTRLRDGSSQFERCRLYLAARCGSCTDASFGAVFRYPLIRLSRPGRTTLSSLLREEAPSRASCRSSGGAHGVLPFAVLLPRTGGLTSLPCRAHVPFVPSASAPIYFRRGDRPPVGGNDGEKDEKGGRSGTRMASTSGLRLPSAVRSRGLPLAARIVPALGFASCRVSGTIFRASRPGSTPIGSSASGEVRPRSLRCRRAAALPNPLMGFRRPSRQKCNLRENCSGRSHPCLRRMLAARFRRPFSVLMGLMPRPPEPASRPERASSLSEVLHLP